MICKFTCINTQELQFTIVSIAMFTISVTWSPEGNFICYIPGHWPFMGCFVKGVGSLCHPPPPTHTHRIKDNGHFWQLSKTSLLTWCISTCNVHKITELWKFELNWSSKLQDNNVRKNTLVARNCMLLDAWNQIREKLLLSRKLRHFKGSRFS